MPMTRRPCKSAYSYNKDQVLTESSTLYHLERRESQSFTFPGLPFTFFVDGTTLCAVVGTPREKDEQDQPAWPGFHPTSGEIVMLQETAYLWRWGDSAQDVKPLEAVTPDLEDLSISDRSREISKLGV